MSETKASYISMHDDTAMDLDREPIPPGSRLDSVSVNNITPYIIVNVDVVIIILRGGRGGAFTLHQRACP